MLGIYSKRRSCRKFIADKMVEKEKIEKIIEAGLQAPSARNLQDGVIIVINDKETRDRLMKLNNGGGDMDTFYGAPIILLVASKKGEFAALDGAAMIENMLLAAAELGLGCCWIHRAKSEIASKEGQELLKFTGLNFDEYEGVGHVILGYPQTNEVAPKIIKEGRVYWSK